MLPGRHSEAIRRACNGEPSQPAENMTFSLSLPAACGLSNLLSGRRTIDIGNAGEGQGGHAGSGDKLPKLTGGGIRGNWGGQPSDRSASVVRSKQGEKNVTVHSYNAPEW